MDEPARIGDVCPECGTRRRVIESLPKQPLQVRKVSELEEAAEIEASYPVIPVPGSLLGLATEEEVTKDIVLATETETKVLGYYTETGWVLEHTFEHSEGESPEEAAGRIADELGMLLVTEAVDELSDLISQ